MTCSVFHVFFIALVSVFWYSFVLLQFLVLSRIRSAYVNMVYRSVSFNCPYSHSHSFLQVFKFLSLCFYSMVFSAFGTNDVQQVYYMSVWAHCRECTKIAYRQKKRVQLHFNYFEGNVTSFGFYNKKSTMHTFSQIRAQKCTFSVRINWKCAYNALLNHEEKVNTF